MIYSRKNKNYGINNLNKQVCIIKKKYSCAVSEYSEKVIPDNCTAVHLMSLPLGFHIMTGHYPPYHDVEGSSLSKRVECSVCIAAVSILPANGLLQVRV